MLCTLSQGCSVSYFHNPSGGAENFCDFIMSYDLECDKGLRGYWAGAELSNSTLGNLGDLVVTLLPHRANLEPFGRLSPLAPWV